MNNEKKRELLGSKMVLERHICMESGVCVYMFSCSKYDHSGVGLPQFTIRTCPHDYTTSWM